MLIALLLDRLIGWPDWVFQRLSHPVVWIGKLISLAEASFNQTSQTDQAKKWLGAITILGVISICGFAGLIMMFVLPSGFWGMILTALIAWPFLASKSLADHVMGVARPLVVDNLAEARQAVSMIVGRDADEMESTAISRAAIESLAENTSDGIIAPVFWGAVFGLPGLIIYKAINTADSMIGYRNERYLHFGWASARLDDLVNLIPARLTGGLYALISPQRQFVFAIMQKDAPQHRSPNAGWPESALAASLGVRLSGPRYYEGTPTNDPWLNATGRDPEPHDIVIGLSRYNYVLCAMAGLLLVGAIFLG